MVLKQTLPKRWIEITLDQILEPSKQKFDPKKEKNQPFVGLEHIGKGSRKIIGKGNSKNTKSLKSIFKRGNILYGKLRPYLNKVTVASFDGVCSTDILVFPQNDNLNSKYVALFLSTNQFVQFANKNMSGVQHPRIKFEKFSEYSIPLAPLNEQKRIVQKIEELFSLIENIEKNIYSDLSKLNTLRSAILKQAFEGKLVPQDPNDEPAEILLEKIKQEKQLIQKQKASRKKKNVK